MSNEDFFSLAGEQTRVTPTHATSLCPVSVRFRFVTAVWLSNLKCAPCYCT